NPACSRSQSDRQAVPGAEPVHGVDRRSLRLPDSLAARLAGMVGADDMAFPRLNMMSFWTLTIASLVLISSFFVPAGPAAGGWTSYAPLSARPIYIGVTWGQNLWLFAVAIEFASFLMGGINFLTTALNLRARGMTLMRLPMLVWTELIAAVLFL